MLWKTVMILTGSGNMNWNESQGWKIVEGNFCVVVKHWLQPCGDRPPNRWNVYAYIYPKHTLFDKFDNAYDDVCSSLPMHGGVTYFQKHVDNDGKPASIEIGCDYDHLGDDRYSEYATKEDATSVFRDAEELIEYLKMKDKDAN